MRQFTIRKMKKFIILSVFVFVKYIRVWKELFVVFMCENVHNIYIRFVTAIDVRAQGCR